MKSCYLTILMLSALPFRGWSQPYDTVRIGLTTSVNMIFDTPIQKWDMGLGVRIEDGQEIRDVLVENPAGSSRRIKLAAGVEDFETTNLFVETERGFYNFILKYEVKPKHLLIKVDSGRASIVKRTIKEPASDDEPESQPMEDPESYVDRIESLENELTHIGRVSEKMLFYVGGIYVSGDHLFFKIYIQNRGNIKYDIGFVGFFKGDKGKSGNKRRPRQEEQLEPVFVSNEDVKVVESGAMVTKVYAFEKFTLGKRQRLYIQFWEGNRGERKVELEVRGRDILGAEPL